MKISTLNAHETEAHRFVAFAPEVGMAPGVFPETFETTLGNGRPFVKFRLECRPDGEVIAAVYKQDMGCIVLRIFND
jgi:hypothetical protein